MATPLAMVLTELLQNAVEHAFVGADQGIITLEVSRDDTALSCKVIDDGAGLPEGFVFGSTPSLGLSIVSTLVSELAGEVSLTSTAAGTTASLHFP
ncbi:MAG: ATP-binding protein [Marmoricola sp.]